MVTGFSTSEYKLGRLYSGENLTSAALPDIKFDWEKKGGSYLTNTNPQFELLETIITRNANQKHVKTQFPFDARATSTLQHNTHDSYIIII